VARWLNGFTYIGFGWIEKPGSGLRVVVPPVADAKDGDGVEDAGVQAIGDTDEGSEAADTTSFEVGTDDKGMDLSFMSRVAYFHSGDKKLYGYIRTLRIDRTGLVVSISGETRIEIDVAGPCS